MKYLLSVVLILWFGVAHAALDIEISGAGENQIPISIVPFDGDEKLSQDIIKVITDDLLRTGLFKIIDSAGREPHETPQINFTEWNGVDAISIGRINKLANDQMEVRFRLIDTVKQTEMLGQMIAGPVEQSRKIAHRIADIIFSRLTGSNGVFSTRIAYISRLGKLNRLVIADSDGYGEEAIVTSNSPLMSPAWSPDGMHIAYVSFEQGRAMIFVQSLITHQRRLLASYPGTNSSPAWSPDGKQLAVVLTHDGSSQIYLIQADGSNLRRLSHSSGIDTEPCFSPDGRYIVFTSDRGGSPQIYRMLVDGSQVQRITFEGRNNFSARYSPDGKSLVFAQYNNGHFFIATQDFETMQLQQLTIGDWDKKPSYAPNGKLILFASEAQGRGILATLSSDGRVKQKMFSQQGDIREPMWSPFNQQ
jgi:TolB protein